MNIIFFITSLGGGGAERVVCNLANYLAERHHSIRITVLRGNDKTYHLNKSVVVDYLQPNYYVRGKSLFYRLEEVRAAIHFFRHLHNDALLVSLLELPVAYSLIFRALYHQKLIICERNNPEFYSKDYQRIFKLLGHKADGCVCQTSTIMQWYQTSLKSKTQTIVIPNSINSEILKANVSNRLDKVIMTMGRLEPQKNQKMLISAFVKIAQSYPNYKLVIYGKGPLEQELKGLVSSLSIEDNVEFKGFTNNVVDAYQHASIFALTSNHEGMPNVLAEAMAMGLTCISTDCGGGGAKELIQDGVNGILISRDDESALIKSLKQVIEDNEFALNLAGEATRIRTTLAPEAIHFKWEMFFKGVITTSKAMLQR